jgi:hypothetical protein
VWRNEYQGDGIVDIMLDIFDEGYARHTVELTEKAYEVDTVGKLCERAGFEVVAVYDFTEKSQIRENSEKAVFVCRKNQQ